MVLRFDPFGEMSTLQRSINRLFDDAGTGRGKGAPAPVAVWTPAVNTYEDKDGFVLTCDLPGLDQQDVNLKLDNHTLSITGTRRLEHEKNRESYHRVECVFGTFARSFSLPAEVDTARIEASMKNGVLTVRLPRREETKPKKLDIQIKG